ncbi:hypothetical protein BS17DRAFT_150830 [Gyrodon lividus]|nr:hypothetical protein BS17DRAFT_150830 [Gyrodon lividus]
MSKTIYTQHLPSLALLHITSQLGVSDVCGLCVRGLSCALISGHPHHGERMMSIAGSGLTELCGSMQKLILSRNH